MKPKGYPDSLLLPLSIQLTNKQTVLNKIQPTICAQRLKLSSGVMGVSIFHPRLLGLRQELALVSLLEKKVGVLQSQHAQTDRKTNSQSNTGEREAIEHN